MKDYLAYLYYFYLFRTISFLPGFQEKHGSYYMFSVKHLLNPQFHANEIKEQSSEKYFSFSIFMRKLSQLGRIFDCVMVVQKEAIGRADPKYRRHFKSEFNNKEKAKSLGN